MSLAKARDLMRLAEMAAARQQGVSLAEIAAEFGADRRTAQRMVRALEDTSPGVEIRTDEDRRRRWKLSATGRAVHGHRSSIRPSTTNQMIKLFRYFI